MIKIFLIDEITVSNVKPSAYYRKKCQLHLIELEKKYGRHFWGLQVACDSAARELYSHVTGRKSNITNLILTTNQAEELFEHFKAFANIWAYRTKNSNSLNLSISEH